MTVLINLFIAAYLIVAVFWPFPKWTFWRRAIDPASAFIERFGFGQVWAMFAPDPTVVERSLCVLLPRSRGDAVRWEPPRTATGSHGDAFVGFRRRLLELMALSSTGAPVRKALAEYLLQKYDFGDDRPGEVLFVCTERVVSPPWLPPAPAASTFIFDTISNEQLNDLSERAV